MNRLYRVLKEKSRGCRDRDVRIKIELFLLALKLGNVAEACSRRGFSRVFYYRWWGRFKRSNYKLEALQERSRRPLFSPKQITTTLEKRIIWFHRKDYGARMIEAMLAREGTRVSRSTICHVKRRREHRPLKRRDRLKTHRKRYELLIPGQRFQIDVKYVPELIEGKKAYTYVAVDECTRWRFLFAYDQICEGTTVNFLEKLKYNCPFPIHTIQTDNGQEFTYRLNPIAQHIKHGVDIWCESQGILHRCIPPGVKELNGKVERSHRIDEQYFYWRVSTKSLSFFNWEMRKWNAFYNAERLHGGLGYITPLEKLSERLEALKTPLDGPEEELLSKMRLRFISETPMRLTKEDRRLNRWERKLARLLNAA